MNARAAAAYPGLALATARSSERRKARCRLRLAVKAGEVSLIRVLQLTPPEIENMEIFDLLLWQPWLGAWTARRLLARLEISEHRRVCELTERQLGCLAAAVEQWRRRGAA